MRTVKVTFDVDMGSGNRIQVETEVIINADEDPEEAGKETQRFLSQFNKGMSEE